MNALAADARWILGAGARDFFFAAPERCSPSPLRRRTSETLAIVFYPPRQKPMCRPFLFAPFFDTGYGRERRRAASSLEELHRGGVEEELVLRRV